MENQAVETELEFLDTARAFFRNVRCGKKLHLVNFAAREEQRIRERMEELKFGDPSANQIGTNADEAAANDT